MDTNMKDRRVLVTAGAAGIGLAIAQSFAAAGASVHVCDVDERALAGLPAVLPGAGATRTDVGDSRAVDALFAALARRWDAW